MSAKADAEKITSLEAYRSYSDQYQKQWMSKAPARILAATLFNRVQMEMKLEQHSIAYFNLSTSYMALLNSCGLRQDEPEDQKMLLNFWFYMTVAAFECGLFSNAKHLAEQVEPLCQEIPEILSQVLDLKQKSIDNISETYGAIRSHLRIPWDDLAGPEHLHSAESIGRLNDMTQKITNGAFVVKLGQYGREMRATRDIKKGETFPLRSHLASSFNVDFSTICYHCSDKLPKTTKSYACPDCDVQFCSATCMGEALSRYHMPLCGIPVMDFFDWYFSEITEVASLMVLNILKIFSEAKQLGISPVEVGCVRDLCVHNSSVEYIDPAGMQVFANILSILQIESGDPRYEFWHYIAVHQRVGANCFGHGTVSSGAGSTLAGFASNANHDCEHFNGTVGENVEILENIKEGEQLLICYIPEDTRGIQRQYGLLSYNIKCECSICGPSEF